MDPSDHNYGHHPRHQHSSQHRSHRANSQQQHQHERTAQHQQSHHHNATSAQGHQHQRRPQHDYETPRVKGAPIIRQTPPSAQHYTGSIASVSRQAQFRKQQQEYYSQALPKIGLDYVDNDNQRTPSPLVLDPAAPTSLPSSASKADAKPGMMQHLLKGIGVTPSSSSMQSPARNSHYQSHSNSQYSSPYSSNEPHAHRHPNQHHPPPQQIPSPPNATDLARLAPKAGFLQKLGTNIPTFKRRFFILQPSTHLYYFLGPNDTAPRGAIPMDDANVRHLEEDLPDGRSRLEISWPNGRSVILEARSREVADEWCQSLQTERIGHVRAQWEESQQELAQANCEIDDLRKQLEHYRYVEEDRDGALEDARRWKEQFEQLDEAIRLLANHIRKPPPMSETKNHESESEKKGKDMKEKGGQEEKKDDGTTGSVKEDPEHQEETASTTMKADDVGAAAGKEETADVAKTAAKALSGDNETDIPSAKEEITNPEKVKSGDNDEPALDYADDNDNEDNRSAADHDRNDVNTSRRDISLLDDDAAAEEAAAALFESSNIIEQLHAPGQHLPALINACQQVRENYRLASEEAISAVEDTKAAQEVAKALQIRMTKAEKQLVEQWQENCNIRKTLKQKKREKRVLVREVKSLMEQQQQLLNQQQEQQLQQQNLQMMGRHQQQQLRFGKTTFSSIGDVDDDASTNIGSDEERLINELEEHVVSSIRLHEEFISASSAEKPKSRKEPTTSHEHLSSSSTATTAASTHSGVRNNRFDRQETTSTNATSIVQHTSKNPPLSSPPRPRGAPLPSLFDRSSFESDSDDIENDNSNPDASELPAENDTSSLEPPKMVTSRSAINENGFPTPVDMDGRSISSVAASFGGDSASSSAGRSSGADTPLRPNPILQLDQAETPVEVVSRSTCFKPINFASRGEATSRLVCPLADVVHTKPRAIASTGRGSVEVAKSHHEEFQVYHLTFYTRKIGVQFQKVPPPPTKPRGLLTDAMTSDLAGDPRGGNKTASELKRVAAISTWAKNDADHGDNDSCLQVATPIDAVLVCGFEGFDDSGNNVRPKLGARLVAFDGVSVEVGKWTFDSIRKAIQARGRPLTLSFRNDFLTTDQRAIMTKSISQAEKSIPPSEHPPLSYPVQQHGSVVQHRQHDDAAARPDSRASAPSVNQVSSHETDQFVNETFRTSNVIKLHERGHPKRLDDDDDDLTVSTTGYYSDYHHHPEQYRRLTGSSGGSFASRGPSGYSNSYRSFSEAGSSASALSSAIGPLVSNLLGRVSSEKKKHVNMNPSYLHSRIPVESTPQHQEFQAGLL